jgi:hypothetical protein
MSELGAKRKWNDGIMEWWNYGMMDSVKLYPRNIFICLFVFVSSSFSQQNAYRFSLESIDDHVVLALQTSEPLPCVGYSIRNLVRWEGDTVVVIVSGFVQPIPCLQGLEPAAARIIVKKYEKKIFFLKFCEEAYSNIWKVFVLEDGFHAVPIQDSFTSYSK